MFPIVLCCFMWGKGFEVIYSFLWKEKDQSMLIKWTGFMNLAVCLWVHFEWKVVSVVKTLLIVMRCGPGNWTGLPVELPWRRGQNPAIQQTLQVSWLRRSRTVSSGSTHPRALTRAPRKLGVRLLQKCSASGEGFVNPKFTDLLLLSWGRGQPANKGI